MHNIIIDETSIVPIFIQVAEWLKEEILQGNIPEGNQVPSVNQIAATSFINPATIQKGFGLLVEEGILYKKRGIGMFVKTGAKGRIYENAKEHFVKETLQQTWQQARKLEMTKEDVIELLKEI
ncbi:MAG: GntR family transcriptional regulator [Lachnospiraceae bacterium]|nr:GntR family transcriptional regulator [Lachnospiraceae bacterium]